ncbi:MAG: FHA domain-containing protein [Ktedonobacteraceae bacterium]|nr:FHA domain-containing protein [Ktedonobacteraceae bacterium]
MSKKSSIFGYQIVDLQSTNHIYVNARRISCHLLKPGDVIHIANFVFTYTGTHLNPEQ